ncbi:vitamin K epoxide reductase family protein [Ramlibacter rhizophilus]|uniref:Vitamin K epoxide reductase family protein n=1 Tax=Ramlibacter rhizophilus TaxID=1781167 RepID=A0A4Z0BS04_9BURK|nr:vitamin K epoxide reductase family protein [Ramlibacter rhizophilus]TFZ01048.1 vitamin K epoxide reductase family protein [Ramlibacter rhizophilus]
MPTLSSLLGEEPQALRYYLQEGADDALTLRRATIVVSLLGIAAMAATTLLQTGVVKNLPDPPRGNFHTRQVNSSPEAYSYGGPDSPIAITTHGVNMVLASMGGWDRPARHPWLPLLATLFAGAQAVTAARYLFWQMPKVDKAWCPYCIVDALTHFATVGLTLPESRAALRRVLSQRTLRGES